MSNKPPTAGRRLDVEARRSQLLAVGSELFAVRPYDDVWIDDVAARAGVSRGLLYHYFGSKRGFLHAVVEHETQTILAGTEPDPNLDPGTRLRASIDGYLRYVETHPHGYRAIFRGSVSADERVRALIDGNLRRQEERILASLAGDSPGEPLRMAVHGWMSFLIATALRWLEEPTLDREALVDLAASMLRSAVAAAGAVGAAPAAASDLPTGPDRR